MRAQKNRRRDLCRFNLAGTCSNRAAASEKDFTVSTSREYWERIRPVFLAGILVNLIARGQALFGSLYSIDAYYVAKKSFDDQIAYNLADGRFLRALLWRLQELLGFSPLASEAASLALASVAIVAAAILFGEAIFGKHASDKILFFVVIFTLHPFLTEYFYYGEVALGIALSVLFAALAVRLTDAALPLRTSIVASAIAVVAALATYQVTIGFIIAGFILASAMEAYAASSTLRRQIGVRAASFVLGAGIYGLCLLVLRSMRPAVGDGRVFSPGGTAFSERLEGLSQAILHALVPPDGIVATPVAAISAILVAGGVIVIVIGIGRRYGRLAAIAAGLLLACALAAACAPSVLSRTPWLAPRLLSPSALVFAALALACLPHAASWRRQVWMAGAGILLLGYIAADASILFDQRRVNLWDHQLANRIVARLEAQPGFASIRRLAVVGRLPAHPFPLRTADHDMNSSAFGAPWSKVGIIEQATGLIFDQASEADIQIARTYCAEHAWPGPGAVTITSQLGIVCLSKL
jgi:hypothetical protein